MTEENVEVVRTALAAFATDEAAWLATLDPDLVWYPIEEGHSASRGYDGASRIRARWFESFEDHQVEIEEVAADGENVVSSIHLTGKGRGSGVAVDLRVHMQWKVRRGRIYYLYEHAERDAAMRAAGLSG